MALNLTGPISIAGTTAGVSIQIELAGNGTTQMSLNDATVRTLAGVASGAIVMPTNFYGKSNGPAATGLFYGGTAAGVPTNQAVRINSCGALVGSVTAVGTARYAMGGAKVGANGLFYGGWASGSRSNLVTRINVCGALVGAQTTAATSRYNIAGATVGSNGLFYAGITAVTNTNEVVRINACGALVGSVTTASTLANGRYLLAGATVGSNGLFYAGSRGGNNMRNLVTRINACGALVGSVTAVGSARMALAGATVGSNGLFYGGLYCCGCVCCGQMNTVTRINSCGALVGAETNAGSAITAIKSGVGF
jgi:hypothetical protein